MTISLPDLPYAADALAPQISAETFSYHHGKHHKAYVDNTNKMIAGTKFENLSLEDIIRESEGSNDGLFNNSAQVWNHTFYWNSMKPNGGGKPTGDIASMIDKSFGSYDEFKIAFANAGATQFGSGWAWLVKNGDKLEVRKTPNAKTPLTENVTPLLTMDVWEHAYYIDHRNARPAYISAFLDNLLNWDFANANLK
ncbi:MAG: superoxide dismutase [Parvularculaceae bacterium]